jgi:flagellar biosynthetic protein FliR
MDPSALTAWFADLPMAMLVFTRVTLLFVVGPVLGDINSPPMTKTLLGIAIAAIVAPVASAGHAPIPLDAMFLLLLVREAMVGFALGFLVDLYFQGIRLGGDLINRHAGYSAAENFDPDTDSVIGPIGDLFHLAMIVLFLATDGHHVFIAAMARSYDIIPVGGWNLTPAYLQLISQGVTDMSVIALVLSFPILAAVMAITVIEGVLTRAVPQINVLHISFAVKIVLSLGVLYAGLPAAIAFMGSIAQLAIGLTNTALPALH